MHDINTEKFEQAALVLVGKMDSLAITDDMSQKKVESAVQEGKDNEKALGKHLEDWIQEAHLTHRKRTTLRNRLLEPFKDVQKEGKKKLLEWGVKNGVKPKGARKVYYATITDHMALIKAVADGSVPLPEMDDDKLKLLGKLLDLDAQAKALKSNLTLPGVTVNSKLT